MGRSADRAKKKVYSERAVVNDFEAQLEYEQNKPKFGPLQPRNPKQASLIQTLGDKRMNFVTGPAGCGKTFVITSWAAEKLESKEADRIVIVRPMVGCDEDIGFLPGSLEEKYSPWLGPFLDVLEGKLGKKRVESYMKYGIISAVPLMMMRGSTFRKSIVILDEAQNTTIKQMKMFLTRIGEGARVVVDGDLEQSDLPGNTNGLKDVLELLKGRTTVGFTNFTESEITRDPLVRDIVMAYRNRN